MARGSRQDVAHTATPLRIVDDISLRGLGSVRVSSTMGRFDNMAMGSCNNVNKLGAMSMHDLNTDRATIDCSNVALDSTRGKRVSVNHVSASGVSIVDLDGNRDSGVFRPTQRFTSTTLLAVRDLTPRFANGRPMGKGIDVGTND